MGDKKEFSILAYLYLLKTLFVSPFNEGDEEEEEDEDEERRVTAVAAASPVLLPKSCTFAKHSRSTSLLNSKPMQISDNILTKRHILKL